MMSVLTFQYNDNNNNNLYFTLPTIPLPFLYILLLISNQGGHQRKRKLQTFARRKRNKSRIVHNSQTYFNNSFIDFKVVMEMYTDETGFKYQELLHDLKVGISFFFPSLFVSYLVHVRGTENVNKRKTWSNIT